VPFPVVQVHNMLVSNKAVHKCAGLPSGVRSGNSAVVSRGGNGTSVSADSEVEMSASVPTCLSAVSSVQTSKSMLVFPR
jgi:hypothetical protein